MFSQGLIIRPPRLQLLRVLTPALSSFGEERENYFVGRLPGVGARGQRTNPGLISFAPMGQVCLASRKLMAARQHRPTTAHEDARPTESVFIRG